MSIECPRSAGKFNGFLWLISVHGTSFGTTQKAQIVVTSCDHKSCILNVRSLLNPRSSIVHLGESTLNILKELKAVGNANMKAGKENATTMTCPANVSWETGK